MILLPLYTLDIQACPVPDEFARVSMQLWHFRGTVKLQEEIKPVGGWDLMSFSFLFFLFLFFSLWVIWRGESLEHMLIPQSHIQSFIQACPVPDEFARVSMQLWHFRGTVKLQEEVSRSDSNPRLITRSLK
jgi:hypothetical protein